MIIYISSVSDLLCYTQYLWPRDACVVVWIDYDLLRIHFNFQRDDSLLYHAERPKEEKKICLPSYQIREHKDKIRYTWKKDMNAVEWSGSPRVESCAVLSRSHYQLDRSIVRGELSTASRVCSVNVAREWRLSPTASLSDLLSLPRPCHVAFSPNGGTAPI